MNSLLHGEALRGLEYGIGLGVQHVVIDYYRRVSVFYDPFTSTPTLGEVPAVIRAQVTDSRILRLVTVVTDAMLERFSRFVCVPAKDFVLPDTEDDDSNDAPFIPAIGDRIEWRSATVRDEDESYLNYRVEQVFPRYAGDQVLSFILALVDA